MKQYRYFIALVHDHGLRSPGADVVNRLEAEPTEFGYVDFYLVRETDTGEVSVILTDDDAAFVHSWTKPVHPGTDVQARVRAVRGGRFAWKAGESIPYEGELGVRYFKRRKDALAYAQTRDEDGGAFIEPVLIER